MIKADIIFKKFGDPIKGADNGVDKAILETLANISRDAKILAPVDSGRLRGSIMYKGPGGIEGDGDGETKIKVKPRKHEGYVGTAVDYGVYQEFGTRFRPPQPFLRPAVSLAFGKSKQEVGKAMNEEMSKETKGRIRVTKF